MVLLSSCGGEKIHHKIQFKGRATDYYTKYPVKNALITISEHFYYNAGPSDDSYIGTWNTDDDGYFDFETKGIHKDKNTTERYLNFSGPAVNPSWYSGRFPAGTLEEEIDARLYTLSRLKFVVINATPFDQFDVISNFYIERAWGNQQVGSGTESLTGTSVNSILWSAYYGYTESILHYSVTKNSVTQNYTDTIFTPDPLAEIWVTDTISY
jgi:hypothetical protein